MGEVALEISPKTLSFKTWQTQKQYKRFCSTYLFRKYYKAMNENCVRLAFLIGRLEISNLSKKLCRQCLMLTKSIKADILYNCTLFLSTFLVFCWFLSSFFWHRRCFKRVCECSHYTCYSFEYKCRLITACYLSQPSSLAVVSKRIFSRHSCPNLPIIA